MFMSNDLRGIRKEIVMTHLILSSWNFDRRAYLLTYLLTCSMEQSPS